MYMYIELSWESRKHYLNIVPHRSRVMFALFCARQVEYEWKDNKESIEAIEVVERWLKGKATAEECMTAADAAAYTANAAYATYAAYSAVYAAAYTAYAANAAAYAAYTAAYAAAYSAAYTAYARQEQVEYLRVLYLESLPEEQRSNWLVQACL